jgi:hypothetical protein
MPKIGHKAAEERRTRTSVVAPIVAKKSYMQKKKMVQRTRTSVVAPIVAKKSYMHHFYSHFCDD